MAADACGTDSCEKKEMNGLARLVLRREKGMEIDEGGGKFIIMEKSVVGSGVLFSGLLT